MAHGKIDKNSFNDNFVFKTEWQQNVSKGRFGISKV